MHLVASVFACPHHDTLGQLQQIPPQLQTVSCPDQFLMFNLLLVVHVSAEVCSTLCVLYSDPYFF